MKITFSLVRRNKTYKLLTFSLDSFPRHEHGGGQKPIVQVKGGKVQSSIVRDLRGTMTRENAAIAILVTLQPPTSHMRQESANSTNSACCRRFRKPIPGTSAHPVYPTAEPAIMSTARPPLPSRTLRHRPRRGRRTRPACRTASEVTRPPPAPTGPPDSPLCRHCGS